MKPIDAWNLLKHSSVELRRWTQTGATGEPFTLHIRDAGRGEAIGFMRNGVEVKPVSFNRFSEFYERWLGGTRSPDSFRNDGQKGSVAQVIYFLIPVFEWLEKQTGVNGAADKLRGQLATADAPNLDPVGSGPEDDTFDDCPRVDYSTMGSDGAARHQVIRSEVRRDPRVRRAVLDRAMGCERQGCGGRRSYPGFLDVHHILGAEKGDRVWNCVALCPSCHRDAHFAPDAARLNAKFLEFAEKFRAEG